MPADVATPQHGDRDQILEALHHCWAERVDRYTEPLARRVLDHRIDALLDQLSSLDTAAPVG